MLAPSPVRIAAYVPMIEVTSLVCLHAVEVLCAVVIPLWLVSA